MSQELPEEVLAAAYEVMWYAKKIGGATDEGKQWSEVFREEAIALRDIAYAAGRSSMREEAAKEPSTGDILLAAGELSKDTLRAVKAVLAWHCRRIRSLP